jgi:multicomponent Na+:H+ antiporter subunit B
VSRRARLLVLACGALGFGALFVLGVSGIPGFGGDFHPYADRAVSAAVRRLTPNVVASVTFDQRAFDTIGEELILFAAALGAVVLLRAVRAEEEDAAGRHSYGPAEVVDALRISGYLLLPVTLLAGVYIVAHGHQSPGGGFQGGVILATAIHLIYLAGDYPALARLRPIPVFEVGEAVAAGAFVTVGLAAAGLIPPMNAAVGVEVGCALVLVLAKFFEQALLLREERAG